MLLNERGLARALKQAYGHGGYHINNSAGQVILYTGRWYIRATWDKFPVKALAAIVEHMGKLPTEECALFLSKDADPQYVLQEKVGDDVARWETEAKSLPVRVAPVKVQDFQLMQGRGGSGPIYGVNETDLNIVTGGDDPKTDAMAMETIVHYQSGEDEDVVVRLSAVRPVGPEHDGEWAQELWMALEGVTLTP